MKKDLRKLNGLDKIREKAMRKMWVEDYKLEKELRREQIMKEIIRNAGKTAQGSEKEGEKWWEIEINEEKDEKDVK